jgi:hypothetical protein
MRPIAAPQDAPGCPFLEAAHDHGGAIMNVVLADYYCPWDPYAMWKAPPGYNPPKWAGTLGATERVETFFAGLLVVMAILVVWVVVTW